MRDLARLDLLFREGQALGLVGCVIPLSFLSSGGRKPSPGVGEEDIPLALPEESHPFLEVSRSHTSLLRRAVEEQPREEEEQAPSAGGLPVVVARGLCHLPEHPRKDTPHRPP